MEETRVKSNRKTSGKTNRKPRILPLILAAVLGVFCIMPATASVDCEIEVAESATIKAGSGIMATVVDTAVSNAAETGIAAVGTATTGTTAAGTAATGTVSAAAAGTAAAGTAETGTAGTAAAETTVAGTTAVGTATARTAAAGTTVAGTAATGTAGAAAAGTATVGPYAMVAVIDSGIDEDNPILNYSNIFQSKSYVDGETSCDDKIGHGTAIAGIIQQYAPGALIVPLMYYTAYASGVPRNGGIPAICKAIYDAVNNYKCKIINISSGITSESDKLKAAIDYAESKGVIVISAVGNDNKIAAGRMFYPAAYDTVIGVGAIDAGKVIASFSQRNKSVMAVMYGVDIKVPGIKNSDRYTTVSGTSYAAAALCGIATVIAEEYPDITPAQFRNLLKSSSQDLGEPGYDIVYGYGVPDTEALKVNLRLLTATITNGLNETTD